MKIIIHKNSSFQMSGCCFPSVTPVQFSPQFYKNGGDSDTYNAGSESWHNQAIVIWEHHYNSCKITTENLHWNFGKFLKFYLSFCFYFVRKFLFIRNALKLRFLSVFFMIQALRLKRCLIFNFAYSLNSF